MSQKLIENTRTRIAAHEHTRWRMDTNCNAWARMPANGHVVAVAGFKGETSLLNWGKQAFEDDSRQRDEDPCSKSA